MLNLERGGKMVLNLSREEVLKVCSACDSFIKESECCRSPEGEIKNLKEMRRCKKWDQAYGSPCLFR
ncbi:MAG: hypothetical protein GX075_12435 [Firmicutes bacterium]|nr:hypothetical protein [Bacillota bacterium]